MTTLYGWGPMFGERGPSPFVLKTDIQLQMLDVSFDRRAADLDAVGKHKAPYVDDDGVIVEDSTFIRWRFERKLGRDLDAGLSAAQRGQAWALERMLEDRLYFVMLHERWLEDENFERGPAQFFARIPEPTRGQVIQQAREDLRQMLQRHGMGRHSRGERLLLAEKDLEAVSHMLGDRYYLFGDRPTAVDASAYGMLTCCGARFFDTPLADLVDWYPNLRPYLARMDALYFDDGEDGLRAA